MSEPPTLTLVSACLLSRFGFNDGDYPEEVYDYLDDLGVEYPDRWEPVLVRLVREHLVPALSEHHRVEFYTVGTSHNPCRADIDGVKYDHTADNFGVKLTPESVTVEWPDVARALGIELSISR